MKRSRSISIALVQASTVWSDADMQGSFKLNAVRSTAYFREGFHRKTTVANSMPMEVRIDEEQSQSDETDLVAVGLDLAMIRSLNLWWKARTTKTKLTPAQHNAHIWAAAFAKDLDDHRPMLLVFRCSNWPQMNAFALVMLEANGLFREFTNFRSSSEFFVQHFAAKTHQQHSPIESWYTAIQRLLLCKRWWIACDRWR